jgi:hypothetical protein
VPTQIANGTVEGLILRREEAAWLAACWAAATGRPWGAQDDAMCSVAKDGDEIGMAET